MSDPRIHALCIPLAAVGLLSACTGEPVRPWEKAYLSRPEMTFQTDVLDAAFADHIYFSKEAAAGGAKVGGGGCGCN